MMTSNELEENHLHHKCGRGTDPLEIWRSAVSNNTYEKETFYKIVKSTAELIYRCAGGASSPQGALRLPHSGTRRMHRPQMSSGSANARAG